MFSVQFGLLATIQSPKALYTQQPIHTKFAQLNLNASLEAHVPYPYRSEFDVFCVPPRHLVSTNVYSYTGTVSQFTGVHIGQEFISAAVTRCIGSIYFRCYDGPVFRGPPLKVDKEIEK